MSARRPVSRQAVGQALAAALVVLVIVVGTTWLQHSGPTADGATLPPLDEAFSEDDVVTCERTLPGEDDSELIVGPVGRITSQAATSCPRRFEGRLVTYVGEVVGDVLRRSGGAWVQVNDDGYALDVGPLPAHRQWAGTNSGLAVWLPEELVEVVREPGRRGLRGDVLIIEGIFLRSDPQDGGGLTIRANHASLLRAATTIDKPVHVGQAIAALLAAAVAIALTIQERIARRQR